MTFSFNNNIPLKVYKSDQEESNFFAFYIHLNTDLSEIQSNDLNRRRKSVDIFSQLTRASFLNGQKRKSARKTNIFNTRKSLGANWFSTIYCVISQVNKYAITQCHSPIKRLSEACWRHCKQNSRCENLFLFCKQRHPLRLLPFCAEICAEWVFWWRHTGGVNILAPGVFLLVGELIRPAVNFEHSFRFQFG